MGWQKRVHVVCAQFSSTKFSESKFSDEIRHICGGVLEVRMDSNDTGMTICIKFPSKQAASYLDQINLTEIIAELLESADVEIHIEAGGVGIP